MFYLAKSFELWCMPYTHIEYSVVEHNDINGMQTPERIRVYAGNCGVQKMGFERTRLYYEAILQYKLKL